MTELKEFLDDLPYRLRIRTTMYLYKEHYEKIDFLKDESSENFLAWICPLLSQVYIPMDQYVYYETDIINEIYFQCKGFAAFVLPFQSNIIYIEIENGSLFGEIDLVVAAEDNKMDITDYIQTLTPKNQNMIR